jgi:hypothetical protein
VLAASRTVVWTRTSTPPNAALVSVKRRSTSSSSGRLGTHRDRSTAGGEDFFDCGLRGALMIEVDPTIA